LQLTTPFAEKAPTLTYCEPFVDRCIDLNVDDQKDPGSREDEDNIYSQVSSGLPVPRPELGTEE
jgi:hypothetical protein